MDWFCYIKILSILIYKNQCINLAKNFNLKQLYLILTCISAKVNSGSINLNPGHLLSGSYKWNKNTKV